MTKNIAIYDTDTDQSSWCKNYPTYSEQIENMLQKNSAKTTFHHFSFTQNDMPADPTVFDGLIITGSAANVSDKLPWMETLYAHILEMDKAGKKIFGLCFGHQALAVAFGGKVTPQPLQIGSSTFAILEKKPWMTPYQDHINLYCGNFQQVTQIPEGFKCIGTSAECEFSLLMKQDNIMSTQFHPELSPAYMHDYIGSIGTKTSPEIMDQAKKEINAGSDAIVFANWISNFLLN